MTFAIALMTVYTTVLVLLAKVADRKIDTILTKKKPRPVEDLAFVIAWLMVLLGYILCWAGFVVYILYRAWMYSFGA